MNKKISYVYLGMILLSSLMLSCSDDDKNNVITPVPVDSSDFRFPFTDGCTWNYTITTSASDIHPDSILYYFNDYPFVITGTAKILYDTVINSVATKCFLDEFTFSGFSYSNRYYYMNNDTALILYAQRQGNGTGLFPLKKKRNEFTPDSDNQNKLNSIELEIQEDSLHSTLKYPMVTGTEWSYNIFNGYSVTKKYLGFENVTIPSGTVSCVKESINYTFFTNGTYYNYFSKYGLLKSSSFFDDVTLSTVTGPDGIGTFDVREETEVTSYIIPAVQ
ncbi:MAG TPA: hypothetical protein PKC91_04415 [Ignavibacteria bacterium]|nr:hypothetical protein [Ignavibacteria bacterium]